MPVHFPWRRPRLRNPAWPLLVLTASLAGCYGYMNNPHHRTADAERERVPPARVTGPAVSCIPLAAFSESRVQDERTIDFMAPTGRRGWRNTLPYGCPGLATEQAFSFDTALSQLCSTDVIRVIQHAGSHIGMGATCGLGAFTPIELSRR